MSKSSKSSSKKFAAYPRLNPLGIGRNISAADRSADKDGESYIFFVGRENYPLSWVAGAKYPRGKATGN